MASGRDPTDLDGLIAPHARTPQGARVVLPGINEATKVGLDGHGYFGLLAAAHRLLPELAPERVEARDQLAARARNETATF
ncbi:hypothetical protein ACFFGR_17635 [Arthrobacter liuii]|uniref:Uncharacterized protein n=1 Tax=Arthrobacter liuii TaxID=1476996 RepID=A0ABQ2AZD3_9MICC|nr:hypothetical protein [Arthrobacter liuii]GGI00082.1 hypothetical protein GCM10007170_36410 [Arthrobacter liuii]